MASNPFFSGRIPQSLFDAVEEYRQSHNVSKTDVLIKALSAYVNLPLEVRSTQVGGDNSRIESLENRVASLEKLLTVQQSKLPETDGQMSIDDIQPNNNIDNETDSSMLVVDNSFDNATETNVEEIIITVDNNGDNNLKAPDSIFIGNMRTVEVANLPGLEGKDSTKIGTKLFRAAKRESKVETIDQYTCVYTGRTDKRGKTGKFEMLWDVYRQANPSSLREEVE